MSKTSLHLRMTAQMTSVSFNFCGRKYELEAAKDAPWQYRSSNLRCPEVPPTPWERLFVTGLAEHKQPSWENTTPIEAGKCLTRQLIRELRRSPRRFLPS
jgi:hypothetical protein